MATATTECFCGMSRLDVLKLILELRIAQFDRLQQLIQALEA